MFYVLAKNTALAVSFDSATAGERVNLIERGSSCAGK